MPLIVPLAQIFGISAQLCVVAFAFGDGFSNVLYPTNPALLISLSLADVNYGRWLIYLLDEVNHFYKLFLFYRVFLKIQQFHQTKMQLLPHRV